MKNIVSSPLYDAQLMRSIGTTTYQGAEIGEVLAIASQLDTFTGERWYHVWHEFADRNMKMAEGFKKEESFLDARMAYLRACTYYRTSFFFLEDHPDDARIELAMQQSINAFQEAIAYFDYPVKVIEIPFDDYALPGYLYLNPSPTSQPRAILVDTGGGDGTKEESYFNVVAEALSRGYHCLSFDGPGQGSVLRLQKKPFISDWERVIQAVIDYVSLIPEVDQTKIALIGRSFGGYLAARAASKEKRIAACIVDPGMLESFGGMVDKFKAYASTHCPELVDASIDQLAEVIMASDEQTRFMLRSRMWRFDANSISEMIEKVSEYSMVGLVEQITCPMLVCDNTLEYITKGQAKKFYDALVCPKEYILFNEQEGTGWHCEPVAPRLFSAKMHKWLRNVLA